jgi:hypothetical protein
MTTNGFVPPEEPLDLDDPTTPYDGTSGWSGNATSRDRAREDDHGGATARRQAVVLDELLRVGPHGYTWNELAHRTGMHHGQASGALTVLHKTGRIVRLTEKRNRCRVYVHPGFVDGRETEPYTPRVRPVSVDEMQETIREAYATLAALGVFDDE